MTTSAFGTRIPRSVDVQMRHAHSLVLAASQNVVQHRELQQKHGRRGCLFQRVSYGRVGVQAGAYLYATRRERRVVELQDVGPRELHFIYES